MGKLTTHVLDTTHGVPGHGIPVALYRLDGELRTLLKKTITNHDGRCDEPLLEGDEMTQAVHELVFSTASYFAARDTLPRTETSAIPFLDDVVIRFGIASADQHYHVPLLISPYSYSTYRGS